MDLEVSLFKGFKTEEKALEDLSKILYLGIEEDEVRFKTEVKQAKEAEKLEENEKRN